MGETFPRVDDISKKKAQRTHEESYFKKRRAQFFNAFLEKSIVFFFYL